MNVTVREAVPQSILGKELSVGEVGIAIEPSYAQYIGHVVLRAYNGVISLTNPNVTWDTDCLLTVRKLAPGTVLTLTVGGEVGLPEAPKATEMISVAIVAQKLTFRDREQIRLLLKENKKINAIKYVREKTGAGLKVAKDYVDDIAYGY